MVNKQCKDYIDMLLASGFHINANKDIFFSDLQNMNNHCNLTTFDMNIIKLSLVVIRMT
jgi:hypothetical protein